MPAPRTILLAGCLSLALAVSTVPAAAPEADPAEDASPDAEASKESRSGYGHLKPLLMEAERVAPHGGKGHEGGRLADGTGSRPLAVHVDPKTRTVRVPVRVTGARGVVEWLLSAGGRHERMSVLVTWCSARAVARALEQAGLAAGRPPEPVGEDAARPPAGPAVSLTLRFRGPYGSPAHVSAEALLADKSDGTPLPKGRWIYVGPQTLADDAVLLAELSGSLVTTALRDTSALVYWVPASSGEGPSYVKAVYDRRGAVPAGVTEAVLEIRPVASPAEPSAPSSP